MTAGAGQNLFQYRGELKSIKIPPCRLSIENLRRLRVELSKAASKAVDTLITAASALPLPSGTTQQDFNKRMDELRAAAGPVVRLFGKAGEQYSSLTADIFDHLPERVTEIQFDSAGALTAAYSATPLNRFTLVFDFTEPPMGMANAANEPTPNKSQLTVIGDDTNWVRGVYGYVLSFVEDPKRRRNWRWLHLPTTFTLYLLFLQIPTAIWLGYRVDAWLISRFPTMHIILRSAIFVYVLMVVLRFTQGVLATLRWAFPVVELQRSRTWQVRVMAVTFVGGLIYALIQDVIGRLLLGP